MPDSNKQGLRREVLNFVDLAHDSRPQKRDDLFLRIAGLLETRKPEFSQAELGLMFDILGQLIGEVEMDLRRDLAEKLARDEDAPQELIVLLANDHVRVAYPLLTQGDKLDDEALIEIIRHRTLQHQLAVAARKNLKEPVSDALAGTGNQHVILALLRNGEAQISTDTMSRIVAESQQAEAFQVPLLERLDLPTHMAVSMYKWVSSALRRHIAENFDVDSELLDQLLDETTSGLQFAAIKQASKPSAAETMVDRLRGEGSLSTEFLIKTLKLGEISLFETGFARMLHLRTGLLRRLIYDRGWEGIAIATRAAGMEVTDGRLVLETIGSSRLQNPELVAQEALLLEELFPTLTLDEAVDIVRKTMHDKDADIIPLLHGRKA